MAVLLEGAPWQCVGIRSTSRQRQSVSPQPDQPSPIGLAAEWVARLTVVGMEMVVFGLGGVWLDQRLSLAPLFALIGFAVGIGIGIVHLLAMTAQDRKRDRRKGDSSHGESGRKEFDE